MKKRISIFLSVVMLFATTVTTNAATINFTDINDVPWEGSKTYINAVASVGLMVGDTNSSGKLVFRAKDRVTYCETVQLAYATLKTTNKIDPVKPEVIAKWTPIMSGYKIPSWAYDCIAYALEENIVSVNDISMFMKSATQNNYATREDVAVIFGKALEEFKPIDTSASLSFNDNKAINLNSVPYIDLLVRNKIIVGDNNNNFNPKNAINRAEMAVITSTTYESLTGQSITDPSYIGEDVDYSVVGERVTGMVIGVEVFGDTKRIDVSANNEIIGFMGDASTPVLYQNRYDKFMDITAGDNVTVDYTGSKINKVILNFDFIVAGDSSDYTGTIHLLTSTRLTLDKKSGGSQVYDLSDGVTMTLNGVSATYKDIMRVVDNGNVAQATILVDAANRVTKITVTADTNTIKGTVARITSDKVVVERYGSDDKTYYFTNGMTVKYEGSSSKITTIMDRVEDGNDISVTLSLDDNGEVIRLEATSESKVKDDLKGTVTKVTEDEITITTNSGSKRLNLTDNPDIIVDGSSMKLSKFITKVSDGNKYTVVLTQNASNSKVSKVTATSEDGTLGFIDKLSSSSITIETSGGNTFKYSMANNVTIRVDGSTKTYSYLEDIYDDYDTVTVALTLNNSGDVSRIDAAVITKSGSAGGTISNVTNTYIVVEKSSGSKSTYFVDDNTKVYDDGDKATIKQLIETYEDERDDIEVTVEYDSRGFAKTIEYDSYVVSGSGYSGSLTNISRTSIKVGKTNYTASSDADVTIDGDSSYSMRDLTDEYDFGIQFDGKVTVSKSKVIKVVADRLSFEGVCQSINRTTITLKGYDNIRMTFDLSNDVSIRLDGVRTTYSDLAYESPIDVSVDFEDGEVSEIRATSR